MYSAAQSKERETKFRVVASNTSIADLFRLDGRTILSTSSMVPFNQETIGPSMTLVLILCYLC